MSPAPRFTQAALSLTSSMLCHMWVLPFLLTSAGFAADISYQPFVPETLLPDGKAFMVWADVTRYTRTYHVSQNHPATADENSRTEARPFKTINHAAQLLQPGERVVVHSGTYRERVRPAKAGEGPDKMISYEAAPGEEVIIKGSRVLDSRWQRSIDANGGKSRGLYSLKLWMTVLPETLFEDGYFPFRTPNASNEELDLMPWALQWKGRVPYSLPRGLLFQEGRRMTQLAAYEDLVRLPGSYWVAPDGKTVHIHAFGSGNPNGKMFEVAVQPHIFQPTVFGLGFIQVRGFTMEQCANGLPRVGIGALYTMGGHHWLIESNTVRRVNSVGIEVGYHTFEGGDKRFGPRTDADLGHHIVRGNRIYDCGSAGIRGLGVRDALVTENFITDCGWQDAQFHYEVAGIKLLVNRGTLVRNNHIARMEGADGIWLDWDNQNSRVTDNIIYDVSSVHGAIFIEASQQTNYVDHNFIWNVQGAGVRAADTDNLLVTQNLFGRIAEDLVYAKVATDRSLHGRRLTATRNLILNNICVDVEKPIASGDPSNFADYNVYVSTGPKAAGRIKDAGEHTITLSGEARFDPNEMVFEWKPAGDLPSAPIPPGCPRDFFGCVRDDKASVAGPFLALAHAARIRLTVSHE